MVFYSYVGQYYSVKSASVRTGWNWTIRLRIGRIIFPNVFSHFQAKDWQWSAQAMSASTGWKWTGRLWIKTGKCCWQKQQEQRRRNKQLNSCCLWPLDLDNKVEYVDQKKYVFIRIQYLLIQDFPVELSCWNQSAPGQSRSSAPWVLQQNPYMFEGKSFQKHHLCHR